MQEAMKSSKDGLLKQAEENLEVRKQQKEEEARVRKEQLIHLRLAELQGGNEKAIRKAREEILGKNEQLPDDGLSPDGTVTRIPQEPFDNRTGFQKLMKSPVTRATVRAVKMVLLVTADLLPIFGGLYSPADLVNGGEGLVGVNLSDGERLAWDRRAVRMGASVIPGPWAWVPPVYDVAGDVVGLVKKAFNDWSRGDKESAVGSIIEAVPGAIHLGKAAHAARSVHGAYKSSRGGGALPPSAPPPPRGS